MDEASRVIVEVEEQAAASGQTFPLSDANLLKLAGSRRVISETVAEAYCAPIGSTYGQLAKMYAEAAARVDRRRRRWHERGSIGTGGVRMPQFTVQVRGAIPIEGGLEGLEHLSNLKHLAGTGIEAVSSQEAAALAISELPLFSDVQLIYVVPDDLGGIEVFLPTAEPVTFERHEVSSPVQRQCLLLLNEQCVRRGVPEGQALFTSDEAMSLGGQWICEACAALVERTA